MKHRLFVIAAIAALAAGSTAGAPAASNGLAWDSVTKVAMGSDQSSLQPGNFDADFATASSVQTQDEGTGGGGIFNKIRQAEAMGKNMAQLMQNGLAEHHYVAGSKERDDLIASQTATITDCVARTITTLDLRAKTYRVESMDHPSNPGSGGGGTPGPRATDDGTRVAIVITNSALGAMQVAGQSTNGYRSKATFTETKSSGDSQTQNVDLTAYYTAYANPEPACSLRMAARSGTTSTSSFAAMGNAARMMNQLAASGMDKRISVKQSGPALPMGNLSMFQALSLSVSGKGSFTGVVERGNLRRISSTDPIFSVPSGFTLQQ